MTRVRLSIELRFDPAPDHIESVTMVVQDAVRAAFVDDGLRDCSAVVESWDLTRPHPSIGTVAPREPGRH